MKIMRYLKGTSKEMNAFLNETNTVKKYDMKKENLFSVVLKVNEDFKEPTKTLNDIATTTSRNLSLKDSIRAVTKSANLKIV